MIYAGIGSRETPGNVLDTMQRMARTLSRGGHILRSGGAKGADKAFEKGECYNRKEIFLAEHSEGRDDWFELASKYHPAWHRCSYHAKLLHARNGAIVLGEGLKSPVDFVVCWTKGGQLIGGTAQAMRIALDYNIPIFNLFDDPFGNRVREFINGT